MNPVQPPAVVAEPPTAINPPGQVMVPAAAPVAVFAYQPPAQIPTLGDYLTINSQDVNNAIDEVFQNIKNSAQHRSLPVDVSNLFYY